MHFPCGVSEHLLDAPSRVLDHSAWVTLFPAHTIVGNFIYQCGSPKELAAGVSAAWIHQFASTRASQPSANMKLPKIKIPKLVTTRTSTGQKEIIGLTPLEWVLSTGALCCLYIVLAGYFTALLFIAKTIQDNKDNVR